MKTNFKHRVYGLVLALILLLASSVFMYFLINTALLTSKILYICCGVFLAFTAIVFVLAWDSRKRIRSVIACILAVILLVVQGFGIYYVYTGKAALQQITAPGTEYAEVGIYVKTEDPADALADVSGSKFGILEVLDRSTTDTALHELAGLLAQEPQVQAYTGLSELLDALFTNCEVRVLVLNKSFLDLLGDTEEHTTAQSRLREIHTVHVQNGAPLVQPIYPGVQKEKDYFTVYISGIDCEGRVSRKSRSDVNILATVNVKTGQVLLVSTPRDYYVPLSISNGIPDKLTHAGIYGVQVSRETLEMLYDIEIDYHFRLNFDGFKDIIDALGGVTVNSAYHFSVQNEWKTITFVKGENVLDGETALLFARERHNVPGGERQRGKNQMAVITAVVDKISSPAMLQNYTSVLDSVADSFETDVPYEKIAELVQSQLKKGTKWNVVSYAVNGTGSSQKPYSLSTKAYVMIPDESTVEYAKTLMQQVKDGEAPQPE